MTAKFGSSFLCPFRAQVFVSRWCRAGRAVVVALGSVGVRNGPRLASFPRRAPFAEEEGGTAFSVCRKQKEFVVVRRSNNDKRSREGVEAGA